MRALLALLSIGLASVGCGGQSHDEPDADGDADADADADSDSDGDVDGDSDSDADSDSDVDGDSDADGDPSCTPDSTDCETIASQSDNTTLEECAGCQGSACDPDGRWACPSWEVPCVDGHALVRSCCEDADCADLGALCGAHTGPHHICTFGDDI